MTCPKCGRPVPAGAMYCTCGAPVVRKTVRCPKCGAINDASVAACVKCGYARSAKNAPAATSQNFANQQRQQNYAQQTAQNYSQPQYSQAQNNYQQQNFQQTAQPNYAYQSTPQNNVNQGKNKKDHSGVFVGVIFIIVALAIGVGCVFLIDKCEDVSGELVDKALDVTNKASANKTSKYAKIECEPSEICSDFEWKASEASMALQYVFNYVPSENWNQTDRDAINYAANYVKSHESLENDKTYLVTLFKHYNGKDDFDGWMIVLRYIRREDNFNVFILRIDNNNMTSLF